MTPLVLWVCDIKISNKLGVREVKTRATFIIHGIMGNGDIKRCVKVLIMAVVERADF